jgi:hypothetical protein
VTVLIYHCCDTDYLFPEHYKIGEVKPPAWNVTDVADMADVAGMSDAVDAADAVDMTDVLGMVVKRPWGYGKESSIVL